MSEVHLKDYYKLLGVKPDATEQQIKKAYHQKASKIHPDLFFHEENREEKMKEATEKFYELKEAYDALINKESRKKYDILYNQYHYYKDQQKQQANSPTIQLGDGKQLDDLEAFMRIVEEYEKSKYEYRREHTQEEYERDIESFEDDLEFGREIRWKEEKEEVKKEEAANRNRHRNIDENYRKKHGNNLNTILDIIKFKTGKFTVHIIAEALYQGEKFKIRKNDTMHKYLFRNRGVLLFLAGATTLTVGANSLRGPGEPQPEEIPQSYSTTVENDEPSPTPSAEELIEEEENQTTVQLDCNYVVRDGDNLSTIAENCGQSEETIKRNNHEKFLDTDGYEDSIFYGDVLKLKYQIKEDDLKYYTQTITIVSHDASLIAEENQTTISTLQMLNPDIQFEYTAGRYMIPSTVDQIKAPYFITQAELKELKEQEAVIKS